MKQGGGVVCYNSIQNSFYSELKPIADRLAPHFSGRLRTLLGECRFYCAVGPSWLNS